MAALSTADRAALWATLMQDASAAGIGLPMLKAELRAAVDAADTWADTNSASYNTALPLPARTVLSARLKAQLLMYVIQRRFEVTP